MKKIAVRPLALALAASRALAACDKKDAAAPATASAPAEVGVVTVQARPLTLKTELPGRTTAYLIAEVRPQVGVILLKRLFEEGSQVKAGQLLYQIDPAPYSATLASAEASLASAKLLSERYDRLIQKHAISQQDRDDAFSQFLQAKASVDTARINLGYTTITSPIADRIGRSEAHV